MASPKRPARIAGILYLAVAVFGGFAEGYVEPKMYVAGNAAATAGNLVANAGLVRLGVVSDLLDQVFFVLLALTLYFLLRQVHAGAATAMVVLVAIAAGIESLNAVFELEGLRAAAQSSVMALTMLDLQHDGLLIAQVFFGLWLAPLGYLAHRSGWFARPLAIALVVAAACYLVDVFAAFLVPDVGRAIHGYVTIPSAVAELWMVGYLLAVGIRAARPAAAGALAAA